MWAEAARAVAEEIKNQSRAGLSEGPRLFDELLASSETLRFLIYLS